MWYKTCFSFKLFNVWESPFVILNISDNTRWFGTNYEPAGATSLCDSRYAKSMWWWNSLFGVLRPPPFNFNYPRICLYYTKFWNYFIFSGVDHSSNVVDNSSIGIGDKAPKHNQVAVEEPDTLKMAAVNNSDVGMLAPKPILFLVLWYFFSGLTLFFNKYIVAIMNGSETLLSMF